MRDRPAATPGLIAVGWPHDREAAADRWSTPRTTTEARRFFRDVLGMPEQEAYSGDGGAEVTILDAGRATLEIAEPAKADMIDDVEVGRRVAPHFRVALEVDDCAAASERATDGGAVPVAPPTRTPWDSLNARFDAPGEVHLTLFQQLT